MILEICANSIQSGLNAQQGGADRIELCTNLEVGGLTPNHVMIKEARKLLSIPIYVLIRPRAGNFVYSPDEIQQMKEDIIYCKHEGCDGVVFGVLTRESKIDERQTTSLMETANFLDVTFHRAFDQVEDRIDGLNLLKEIGIQRILTSGGADTALEGFDELSELIDEAGDDVIVMPGGGVRPENIQTLLATGASEFHSSAIKNAEYSDLEVVKALASKL